MEVIVPWESMGFGGLSDLKVATGSKLGLNLVLVDDDKGGNRDTRLSWVNDYGPKGEDGSHHNPSLFGTAELTGSIDPSLATPPYMTQATATR